MPAPNNVISSETSSSDSSDRLQPLSAPPKLHNTRSRSTADPRVKLPPLTKLLPLESVRRFMSERTSSRQTRSSKDSNVPDSSSELHTASAPPTITRTRSSANLKSPDSVLSPWDMRTSDRSTEYDASARSQRLVYPSETDAVTEPLPSTPRLNPCPAPSLVPFPSDTPRSCSDTGSQKENKKPSISPPPPFVTTPVVSRNPSHTAPPIRTPLPAVDDNGWDTFDSVTSEWPDNNFWQDDAARNTSERDWVPDPKTTSLADCSARASATPAASLSGSKRADVRKRPNPDLPPAPSERFFNVVLPPIDEEIPIASSGCNPVVLTQTPVTTSKATGQNNHSPAHITFSPHTVLSPAPVTITTTRTCPTPTAPRTQPHNNSNPPRKGWAKKLADREEALSARDAELAGHKTSFEERRRAWDDFRTREVDAIIHSRQFNDSTRLENERMSHSLHEDREEMRRETRRANKQVSRASDMIIQQLQALVSLTGTLRRLAESNTTPPLNSDAATGAIFNQIAFILEDQKIKVSNSSAFNLYRTLAPPLTLLVDALKAHNLPDTPSFRPPEVDRLRFSHIIQELMATLSADEIAKAPGRPSTFEINDTYYARNSPSNAKREPPLTDTYPNTFPLSRTFKSTAASPSATIIDITVLGPDHVSATAGDGAAKSNMSPRQTVANPLPVKTTTSNSNPTVPSHERPASPSTFTLPTVTSRALAQKTASSLNVPISLSDTTLTLVDSQPRTTSTDAHRLSGPLPLAATHDEELDEWY